MNRSISIHLYLSDNFAPQIQNACIMKKLHFLAIVLFGLSGAWTRAQEVGIGNTAPAARLDIQAPAAYSSPLMRILHGGATYWFVSNTGNVGIGTGTPQYRLHVADDGMIYAEGTYGTGSDMPTGAQVAFIWNPKKAALRAGRATATQWDPANVGNYSVAMGYNSIASGFASTVSGGFINTAAGIYGALGGGWRNHITGDYATIGGGRQGTASGDYAFVGGGYQDTASGAFSMVAGGLHNVATANYSVVGGGRSNRAPAAYGTISGGYRNVASGNFSTVGGGAQDTADGYASTVSGGSSNRARQSYSSVGGGIGNAADGYAATIAGGEGNDALQWYTTVSGGRYNTALGWFSTVAGGGDNTASGDSSTIAGGRYNTASGDGVAIGGGLYNQASGYYAAVSGGRNNYASGYYAAIGGGYLDSVTGHAGTVGGGFRNVAQGSYSFVGGGWDNKARGYLSAIVGGFNNTAYGYASVISGGRGNQTYGTYSWVGGQNMKLSSSAAYTFVWGVDPTGGNPSLTASRAFLIGPYGYAYNVGINVADPQGYLHIKALDAGPNSSANGASIVVGDYGGQHLEIDDNEIHAMNGSGPARLFLNGEGGTVTFFSIGGNTGQIGVNTVANPPSHAITIANSTTPSIGQGRAQAWTTYSDQRIKSDLQPIADALGLVRRLRPFRYYHHSSTFDEGKLVIASNGTYNYGFIAQELSEVVPEAVYVPTDEASDLWGVNYDMLVPILTAAIQQLAQENAELKQRMATLEKRIAPPR